MATDVLLRWSLQAVFDGPIVTRLQAAHSADAASVIGHDLGLKGPELALIFQESYAYTLASVAVSLVDPEVANRQFWRRLLLSSLPEAVLIGIQDEYWSPFARHHGFGADSDRQLRHHVVQSCYRLAEQRQALFPEDGFPETIGGEAVVGALPTQGLNDWLLGQIHHALSIPRGILHFLKHRQLLTDGFLFFVRAQLREDSRVLNALGRLEQQGLWVDPFDLRKNFAEVEARVTQRLPANSADGRGGPSGAAGDLPNRLREGVETWERHFGGLATFLHRFQPWAQLPSIHPDNVLDTLDELIQRNLKGATATGKADSGAFERSFESASPVPDVPLPDGTQLEALRQRLEPLLFKYGLLTRLRAGDQYTSFDAEDRNGVLEADAILQTLSEQAEGYTETGLLLASALFALGEYDRPIELLERIRETSPGGRYRALASHNLFQVYMARGDLRSAYRAYRLAAEADPGRFALVDWEHYEPQELEVADEMGCLFICRDIHNDRLVSIRTFWDARAGSLETAYQEAFVLRESAEEAVPKPLAYGYVSPKVRGRPYLVTDYRSQAWHGGRWFQEHGVIGTQQAIRVALQAAQILATAHAQEIYHLDLKPAQVLLEPRLQEGFRVVLRGFGVGHIGRIQLNLQEDQLIANFISVGLSYMTRDEESGDDGTAPPEHERFGQLRFGANPFAPPEFRGEHPGLPGVASDLFGLAACILYLRTGLYAEEFHTYQPAEGPEARLFEQLQHCLEPDPAKRPNSAMTLAERLEILDGHSSDLDRSTARAPSVGTLNMGQAKRLQIRAQTHPNRPLKAVAYAPDGRHLAISGGTFRARDYRVYLWDLNAACLTASLGGHTDTVQALTFSPDGRWLATGSNDFTIRLWDRKQGSCARILRQHSEQVNGLTFSPDSRYLLSAGGDMTLRLWAIETGQLVRTFRGHTDWVKAVAFSRDGRLIASGAADATLRLWDVADGKRLQVLGDNPSWVRSVAFSPGGERIAAATGNLVRIWQIESGELLHTLANHTATVRSLVYSADGQWLASASKDGTIKLIRTADPDAVGSLEGHLAAVNGVAFSPTAPLLASVSDDKTVKMWGLAGARELAELIVLERDEWIVATPEGYFAASPGGEELVQFVVDGANVATSEQIAPFRWPEYVATRLQSP